MSWTDHHQTVDSSENSTGPFTNGDSDGQDPRYGQDDSHATEFGDTEREATGDNETGGTRGTTLGMDDPLTMTQCPVCDGHKFVSKKLVYEEFHYTDDGDLEAHHNRVRAEFELTCMECGKRQHELPDSCRTFYNEVWVLKQDLRRATRRQWKRWTEKTWDLLLRR